MPFFHFNSKWPGQKSSMKVQKTAVWGSSAEATYSTLNCRMQRRTGRHLKMGSLLLCALRDGKEQWRRQGGAEIGLWSRSSNAWAWVLAQWLQQGTTSILSFHLTPLLCWSITQNYMRLEVPSRANKRKMLPRGAFDFGPYCNLIPQASQDVCTWVGRWSSIWLNQASLIHTPAIPSCQSKTHSHLWEGRWWLICIIWRVQMLSLDTCLKLRESHL